MPVLDLIAGARPNFVKIAPLIHALHSRERQGGPLRYRLVHTGQHYDSKMSGDFFRQLEIPEPHVNLKVGSGSHAEQTAAIMLRYEAILAVDPPDLTVVVGDVTSTMACSITARRAGVPVAHVEAGLRSGDWAMPEEINRVVTDSVSNYFFTTSRVAGSNLLAEGVTEDRIFFVGNTMIDTLLARSSHLQPPPIWDEFGLRSREYVVLTLHRPANVDEPALLRTTLCAVSTACRGLPVVFPVHPRTQEVLRSHRVEVPETIRMVEPLGYLQFSFLVREAKAAVTDSGGVTEEATLLGLPCLTLRENTERPETVEVGTNELVGTDPGRLTEAMDRVFAGTWKKGAIPEKWDGRAGERIVGELERILVGRDA